MTKTADSAPLRRRSLLLLGLGAVLAAAAAIGYPHGASGAGWGPAAPAKVPAAAFDPPAPGTPTETAVLSGGCFWGLQGVFEHVKGVRQVLAGYAGGQKATAEYELVSTGTTGHAESVKIVFDPREISYGEILRIYFSVATDPTQLNAQYPDEGPQYRGDIFYADPAQKAVAERYIAQLEAAHVFHRKIVTRIDAYSGFYPAETYHQDYLQHHPDAAYIATYDLPKVAALKTLFPDRYRPVALKSS
jgi:peptide-methionine (S)-S-oxide reductase